METNLAALYKFMITTTLSKIQETNDLIVQLEDVSHKYSSVHQAEDFEDVSLKCYEFREQLAKMKKYIQKEMHYKMGLNNGISSLIKVDTQ